MLGIRGTKCVSREIRRDSVDWGAVPGAGGQAGMTANGCEVCFRGAGSDLELNLGTAAP